MPFLEKLITEKTPILQLHNDSHISYEDKLKALGCVSAREHDYMEYMYYMTSIWYYFKPDTENYGYPFAIIDELMGSYLANQKGMPAVAFQIAQVENQIGLASINFHIPGFQYYYCSQIPLFNLFQQSSSIDNKEKLEQPCPADQTKEELITQMLKMIALDLYMLQKDRCLINLQIEIDSNSKHVAFAPLHDFSNCNDCVGPDGLYLKNPVVTLTYATIRALLKKYPEFREYVSFFLGQKMSDTWNQICQDYHLNQDCYTYENILEHYKIKEEKQKIFINDLLKNVS